jgi:hypothetical protein
MKEFFLISCLLACCAASTNTGFPSEFAKNYKPVNLLTKGSFLSGVKFEMGQSVMVSSGTFSEFHRSRFPVRFLDRLKGAFKNFVRFAVVSPAKKLKNILRPIRSNRVRTSVEDDVKDSQQLSVGKRERDFEISYWIPVLTVPLLLPSKNLWIPVSTYQNISNHAKKVVNIVVTDRAVRTTNEVVESARGAVEFIHQDLMATKSVTPEGAFGAYCLVILLSLFYLLVLGKYLSLPLLRYVLGSISHKDSIAPLLMKEPRVSVCCDFTSRESDLTNCSCEEVPEKALLVSQPAECIQGQLYKYDDDAGSMGVPEDDDDGGLSGLLQRKYAHRSEAKEGFEEDDDDNQYLTSPSTSGSTDCEEYPVVMQLEPLEGAILLKSLMVSYADREEYTELEFEEHVKTPRRPTRAILSTQPTPDNLDVKCDNETEKESRDCDAQKAFEELIYSPNSQTSSPTRKAAIKAFNCVNPFDQNGVILYLNSPARLAVRKTSIVRSRMSTIFIGSEDTVIAQSSNDLGLTSFPNYTTNVENSWCAIDLGVGRRLRPTQYCIRHGASSIGNALRSWELRGREKDRDEWEILKVHINDDKLNHAPHSVALWDIEFSVGQRHCPSMPRVGCTPETTGAADQLVGQTLKGYRYFLLLQTDVNSSGNHCLFIGGLELYGILMER